MPTNKVFKAVSILCAVVFTFCCAASAATGCGPQDKQVISDYLHAQPVFEKGLEHLKAGEYDRAIECFEKTLQIMPQHAEAALDIGLCRYHLGDYEEALQNIQAAKEKYLAWFTITYEIAAFQQMNAKEEATVIKEVQLADGASACAINQELVREAEKMSNLKHPSAESAAVPAAYYFHAGNCYLKLKKYEEAYTEYAKAIEADPKYGEAYANLAVIYFLAEDYVDSWLNLQMAKKYGAPVNPDFEKSLVSRMQQ